MARFAIELFNNNLILIGDLKLAVLLTLLEGTNSNQYGSTNRNRALTPKAQILSLKTQP